MPTNFSERTSFRARYTTHVSAKYQTPLTDVFLIVSVETNWYNKVSSKSSRSYGGIYAQLPMQTSLAFRLILGQISNLGMITCGTDNIYRNTSTLTQWEIWAAATASSTDVRNKLISAVLQLAVDGKSSKPFGDWYNTLDGTTNAFSTRPMVGGHFAFVGQCWLDPRLRLMSVVYLAGIVGYHSEY